MPGVIFPEPRCALGRIGEVETAAGQKGEAGSVVWGSVQTGLETPRGNKCTHLLCGPVLMPSHHYLSI